MRYKEYLPKTDELLEYAKYNLELMLMAQHRKGSQLTQHSDQYYLLHLQSDMLGCPPCVLHHVNMHASELYQELEIASSHMWDYYSLAVLYIE